MRDKPDASAESLAIPLAIRVAVDERDAFTCRLCGKFLGDRRCLHHIRYGGDDIGMGGRRVHDVDTIITLCWLPGDPVDGVRSCHERVHGAKAAWQGLLLQAAQRPGVTALQLKRWQDRKERGARGQSGSHPRY